VDAQTDDISEETYWKKLMFTFKLNGKKFKTMKNICSIDEYI
jgi:hypothetical protein